nr:immunoglobulin heavy chain junction region [Mus musculus]NSM05415.1 immunoglobulin heavy chain junction region [Mus musculus]NSM05487.1 immunoglobulin heavy chain junction region [Mus musculus]NSM06075.1 immunoglobulin heavy chain junction region [Mus musculus]NSM06530.1 immunoglobulin heavy chain junction region [Mus musculus]
CARRDYSYFDYW